VRVLFVTGPQIATQQAMLPLALELLQAGHRVEVHCAPGADLVALQAGLSVVTGDAVEFSDAWQPDLVVFEPSATQGPAAAASVRAPAVGFLPYAAGGALPDGAIAWIDPCPTPLRARPAQESWPVRCAVLDLPEKVPSWLEEPPGSPRVCVAWESGTAEAPGDGRSGLFRRVVEGAAALELEVVVLADGGVPWRRLIETCAAVVHVGEDGPAYAAVECGVPQLIVPRTAAQFCAGTQLERSGIGRVLPLGAGRDLGSALRIRSLVAELVHGGHALPAAHKIARAQQSLPTLGQLVPRLEAAAWSRRR
jgi:hypothetical protein